MRHPPSTRLYHGSYRDTNLTCHSPDFVLHYSRFLELKQWAVILDKSKEYGPEEFMQHTMRIPRPASRLVCQALSIAMLAAALGIGVGGSVIAAPPAQGRAEIMSPKSGDIVQGAISIRGTATHPNFWKYELAWAISNRPGANWNLITVQETPVVDGQLAAWNTALIPDGTYDLRLRVVRQDANYEEVFVRSIIVANEGPPLTLTTEATLTPLPTLTPLATLSIPTTPTVRVSRPTEAPTPSPAPVLVPTRSASGPDIPNVIPTVDVSQLAGAFCYGAGITLAIFLLLGILQLLRRILPWILR